MRTRPLAAAGLLGLAAALPAADPPRPPEPRAVFARLDENKDGKLARGEFEKIGGLAPRLRNNPDLVAALFDRLDADKDGSLTADEFRRVAEMRPGARPPEPKPEPKPEEGKSKHRFPDPPPDDDVPLVPPAWKAAPVTAATPAEIDALLSAAQAKDGVMPAGPVGDELFARRAYLDLSGRLPPAAVLEAFAADADSAKRAKLIDRLLDSDDFARHLGRAWRDIIVSRATAKQAFFQIPRQQGLEKWLTEQFRGKRSWAQITRDLLTAEGEVAVRKPTENGRLGFLLCHQREDGPVERANDTARVFLGVNVQCAQCHDAPNDVWKRRQFHELAAFFGKTGERVRPSQNPAEFTVTLTSRPFGDYAMPDLDDPKKTHPVSAKFFLTGQPARGGDAERRAALADFVTAGDNYYFAAAFVNRVWGDLMGQAFVQPVDNLGPLSEAVYPEVLVRLAASFRASDFDVRSVYRTVMNTRAYQREFRLGGSAADHTHFAGAYPTKLRSQAMWDALNCALGRIDGAARVPGAPRLFGRFPQPFAMVFEQLFAYDLSKPADQVEGTVPQALMLMNNAVINGRMAAAGDTVLAGVLKATPDDAEAVRQVYRHVLGRSPSDRELARSLEHVRSVGDRAAAFEDLLWVLVNSAEFRTKR